MAIGLGMIVGVALGLTGGGGSIFAVPLLIHGLGLAPREAIDVSLVAVASTAAFGAIGALRARMIEYRAGLVLRPAACLPHRSAYAGAATSHRGRR